MDKEQALILLEAMRRTYGLFVHNPEEYTKAISMSMNALEKQIPKKIIPADEEELAEQGWYMCPVCHTLEYYSYKSNYCDDCGQRLD